MKRAIRRHHEDRVKKANKAFARKILGWNLNDVKIFAKKDWQRHPCDCGKTGCQLCHYAKIFDRPSHSVAIKSEALCSRTRVRPRDMGDA